MKKYILSVLAGFLTIGAVSAMTITGTPSEIKELSFQNNLGGAWSVQTYQPQKPPNGNVATSSNFIGNVSPQVNNAYDLGAYTTAWRNIFASGTIYATNANIGTLTATINLNTDEPLSVGNGVTSSTINGSSTSTFPYGATFATTGGNVGIGTTAPMRKLSVISTGLNGIIAAFGNGTATTTIAAGDPGIATSTFAGDVSIPNLYSGELVLPTDSGMSDLIDIGVSGSAATTTAEGYNFAIDGRPLITLTAKSDALGSVYNGWVGIGTQTPSSTLHIAPDFMATNRTATATLQVGSQSLSPACHVDALPNMTLLYWYFNNSGAIVTSTSPCNP